MRFLPSGVERTAPADTEAGIVIAAHPATIAARTIHVLIAAVRDFAITGSRFPSNLRTR
jgi:hypothetical protein